MTTKDIYNKITRYGMLEMDAARFDQGVELYKKSMLSESLNRLNNTETEKGIIEIISTAFNMKNYLWVSSPFRWKSHVICRQVLMTVLKDMFHYSLSESAKVCNRDHTTAVHATKVVYQTLWGDKVYGETIRYIFDECRKLT